MIPTSNAETTYRLPGKYIAAAYVESIPGLGGSLLGLWIAWFGPETFLAPLIVAISLIYIFFSIVEPLWQRKFTSIAISGSGLRVTTGYFDRRERTLFWSDVDSYDSRQSWAYRPFSLYVLDVAQAGDQQNKIRLPGVGQELHDHIVARIESERSRIVSATASSPSAQGVDAPGNSAEMPPAEPGPESVYRAHLRDLLLAGLVYGQFALIGASFGVTVRETLDQFGLAGAVGDVISANPLIWGVAIGLCLCVAGLLLTVLRYANFQVYRQPDGRLDIRYGLIDTHERRVDPAAIVGLVLHQNMVETLLGRSRLALLSTDSSAMLGGNLLLPSLPTSVVRSIVRESFSELAPPEYVYKTRRLAIIARIALLLATLSIPLATFLLTRSWGAPAWLALCVALITFGLAWWLGSLLCSRLVVLQDGRRIMHVVHHVATRFRLITVESTSLVSTGFFLRRPLFVSVAYLAGAPKVLRAVRFVAKDVASFENQLIEAARRKPMVEGRRRRLLR